MGESSVNQFGFNTRAAALLNKELFSDVEIQVKDGNNHKTFFAHKLFLSMSSREFASMFYGKFESPKFIKIFDFKPHTVYLMLQYLYSDNCDVSCIEEAKLLYSLANKYCIDDLAKYCLTYLSKEKITLDNLFDKYEFALSENITPVLEECRDLVSAKASSLLKCSHFTAAPLSVVEDILKLDTLNVKSEMEVIVAAVEWARQECLRRGSYTENLRICLYPLFKYLRFLSLTAVEFCDFVEKNENILNSHESTRLTMSLINPNTECRLPSGFTSNSSPRFAPSKEVVESTRPTASQVKQSSECLLPSGFTSISGLHVDPKREATESSLKSSQSQLSGKTERGTVSKNAEKESFFKLAGGLYDTVSKNAVRTERDTMSMNVENESFFKLTRGIYDTVSKNAENTVRNELDTMSKNAESHSSFYKLTGGLYLDYKPEKETFVKDVDYITMPAAENIEQSSKYGLHPYKRSESLNLSSKKQAIMKVSPLTTMMTQRRTFEFPLKELGKSVTSAFASDIKCSATIHLHRGTIQIYGIELKIQEKEDDNDIKAFLSVVGSDRPLEISYDGLVKNGIFSMEFSEPLILVQNSIIKIEVVVEDLILNRCYGYFKDKCEFNCGLNIKAEITMKSNQYDDERGYFFLISRLLYKPHQI